jgi:hypothetical protein
MAWDNDLDPISPADIELVSEGAESIRELKRVILERFGTAFEGLEVAPDAGNYLLPLATAQVGLHSQRPAPSRPGQGWISTDTRSFYVSDNNFVWMLIARGGVPTAGVQAVIINANVIETVNTTSTVVFSYVVDSAVSIEDYALVELRIRARPTAETTWSTWYWQGVSGTADAIPGAPVYVHSAYARSQGAAQFRLLAELFRGTAGSTEVEVEFQATFVPVTPFDPDYGY